MATNRSNAERLGTILVADDHDVVRQGLATVLLRDLGAKAVIEAATFDDALKQLADPCVFLAVVDLGMPGMTGPGDLTKIRRLRPDIRVIVLSGSEARGDILAALDAGAHGYLVKSERTSLLIERIQRVLGGEIYVPPIIAELPAASKNEPAKAPLGQRNDLPSLTDRQRDVLRLIIEGMANKEIAAALGVSQGTVKLHVTAVLRAIGAKSRTHAAAIGKKFLDQGGAA